jgi:hypothetical protein
MDARLPSLPSATRALLRQERVLPAADPALRRRVLERARGSLKERPSGVGLRLGDAKSPPRPSSRWAQSLLLVAAGLALVGLAAAGMKLYQLDAPAGSSEKSALPKPPAQEDAAPSPVHAPAFPSDSTPRAAVDPVEAPRPATAPGEPARAPGVSTYALELQLLEPARKSIAQGELGAALAAIARHQREYPRGQLAEEREALRVRALWGMGARAEAESAAAVFRKRYPHSGLLGWMKPVSR